mmetsp:Transcript_23922/g.55818  ORF Transcript_23922/g.55818 Transcript_23922/m.55818 type:complete len:96 (-) Transcript_23922:215-502(-)
MLTPNSIHMLMTKTNKILRSNEPAGQIKHLALLWGQRRPQLCTESVTTSGGDWGVSYKAEGTTPNKKTTGKGRQHQGTWCLFLCMLAALNLGPDC